ncbi:unnamed protein product (mitochondrion) [Plasmodiophora brassicae]|uniref:RIIa domain-containing protein n=1 Tax=Plasmodiophora brassicae TaxID=37360 RepID=A0A0G4IHC4_PLABS|nr:hypothetical protein PBRA_000315 [Plasmodiophora brassicae]SPQ96876.1 unnamed protein product [Plasmodiophora brassicae]
MANAPDFSSVLPFLTEEEQAKFTAGQSSIFVANEVYLREHPELGTLVRQFLIETLRARPANVEKFAYNYFCKKR